MIKWREDNKVFSFVLRVFTTIEFFSVKLIESRWIESSTISSYFYAASQNVNIEIILFSDFSFVEYTKRQRKIMQ